MIIKSYKNLKNYIYKVFTLSTKNYDKVLNVIL